MAKLKEITFEEYEKFLKYYLLKLKSNGKRKIKFKQKVNGMYVVDENKHTVCSESFSFGKSKYLINPSYYEEMINSDFVDK